MSVPGSSEFIVKCNPWSAQGSKYGSIVRTFQKLLLLGLVICCIAILQFCKFSAWIRFRTNSGVNAASTSKLQNVSSHERVALSTASCRGGHQ